MTYAEVYDPTGVGKSEDQERLHYSLKVICSVAHILGVSSPTWGHITILSARHLSIHR